MSIPTIVFGDIYNIKKYYNLDEGVEEICPRLLKYQRVKDLCMDLKLARRNLEKELDSLVIYDE